MNGARKHALMFVAAVDQIEEQTNMLSEVRSGKNGRVELASLLLGPTVTLVYFETASQMRSRALRTRTGREDILWTALSPSSRTAGNAPRQSDSKDAP